MPGRTRADVMMPVVGILLARVEPRYLILLGFLELAASLFHLTGFDLQISSLDLDDAALRSGGRDCVPVRAAQHGLLRGIRRAKQ